jgi:hypothetical protein
MSCSVWTPLARIRYSAIGGHFFDPLKVMSIDQLIKGKSSPLVRWIESGFTGSDWRDVPFQGVTDWLKQHRQVR